MKALSLSPKVKAFLSGLVIAGAVVLGQALILLNASQAIDWNLWLHTLIATEAGAMGHYLVTQLSSSPATGQ